MKFFVLGLAVLALLGTTQARNEEDGRVVAAYSTMTAIVLSTSTTTVPYTCAILPGTVGCQRRRYRRFMNIDRDLTPAEELSPLLEGTMDTPPEALDETDEARFKRAAEGDREPRIALTVWTTTSSTFTFTSESVNSSTTFSLSYFCTVVGAD